MKNVTAIIFAMTVIAGCSTGTGYTITGSDPAFIDGQYAYLTKEDNGQIITVDSTAIADNCFSFKGEAEYPVSACIIVGASQEQAKTYIDLYLERGNICVKKVKPEHRAFNAVGTPLNDIRTAHNCKMWDCLMDMQANGESQDKIMGKIMDIVRENIKENKDNLVGVDLLCQTAQGLEPQEIIDLIASIPMQNFPESVQAKIESTKRNAEMALRTVLGNNYIDIAQKDADGKEVTLGSVIQTEGNKYVLVDFWASWCSPCMGEVPFLVETYTKYHGKGFEIYGVSFDSDRTAWTNAVKDNAMTWIQVSDVKGWDNQARHDYVVNSIPANYLVDCSTGKIVATNLRGEALQRKIAELLD